MLHMPKQYKEVYGFPRTGENHSGEKLLPGKNLGPHGSLAPQLLFRGML